MVSKVGLKFTALYKSNLPTFEMVNHFKDFLSLEYKDMLILKDLEWVTLYNNDPQEHYREYGFISLVGLNEITFNISAHLVELVTEWEWLFFLKDLEKRKDIRDVCLRIVKYLGNPIYVPDSYCYSSYLFEDKTYTDVLASLRSQYGDPVKDILDMLVQYEMYWDTAGYYIDER